MSRPAHHDPEGGFRNPWPGSDLPGRGALLRWWWDRRTSPLAPDPDPADLPRAEPDPTRPRAAPDALRATWIGHASFLLQVGGLNLLTDPVLSRRASPLRWAGPERFVPPGLALEDLPPIDAVLLSHDHYDHLDAPTVDALRGRFGDALRWITPLGYGAWFGKRGIRPVELDWWEEAALDAPGGALRVRCLPAQHWTNRTGLDRQQRLWASWAVRAPSGAAVYFGGDSGWFPGYPEIGARAGPFDLALLPIGAYEPRWFMRSSHMNPEEAVEAFAALGGRGVMGGMHWGTFRLTDEDPLEPPDRARAAWRAAGLPAADLWIPRHGETRDVPPRGPSPPAEPAPPAPSPSGSRASGRG